MNNEISDITPLVVVMSFFAIAALCFLFYCIGTEKGVNTFVNKMCQQTQYEFCNQTYKYKQKGDDNE